MDQKKITRSLTIFKKRVTKAFKPERVILFGSYIYGKPTEYSDIDIIVVSDKFIPIPKQKRLDHLYDLFKDLEPDFHVFGLTKKEFIGINPLTTLYEAVQKGVVI